MSSYLFIAHHTMPDIDVVVVHASEETMDTI